MKIEIFNVAQPDNELDQAADRQAAGLQQRWIVCGGDRLPEELDSLLD